jgi:F-type H+-transporting ATPase subunit delta
MSDQYPAKAYAKAIVEISKDQSIKIADELTLVTELINQSNDLENVLFLDLFTNEEKASVLQAVLEKVKLSPLTKNFLSYLISEKRFGLFPLIFKEVIVMDDDQKGFLKGSVEGSEATITTEDLNLLKDYLSKKLNRKIELSYSASEYVTAGFRVTVDDLQLDATIDSQFDQLKD